MGAKEARVKGDAGVLSFRLEEYIYFCFAEGKDEFSFEYT